MGNCRYWSNSALNGGDKSPVFYITLYAIITTLGLIIGTIRWFVLYTGSINASTVLYERLLESILFADIRFHDTVSRGRVLNRFGKDFEGNSFSACDLFFTQSIFGSSGIDSSLSDNFGRSIIYGLSAATTIITVSVVGGPVFIIAALLLGSIYWNGTVCFLSPVLSTHRMRIHSCESAIGDQSYRGVFTDAAP